MKLSCVHCGNEFSIRAEQLGTRGRCPHCRAMITLPKADDTDAMPNEEEEKRLSRGWKIRFRGWALLSYTFWSF